MTPIASFLAGVAITLCASFVVVLYLRTHLRRILTDLCGTVERAVFWTAFSNVLLILVPLICALFRQPNQEGNAGTAFFDITAQLTWALIGLVLALVILAVVITFFIAKPSPILPSAQLHGPTVPGARNA